MDSFHKCRLASEKVAWSFEEALGDLSFDHDKCFLPRMLCLVSTLPLLLKVIPSCTEWFILLFSLILLLVFDSFLLGLIQQ